MTAQQLMDEARRQGGSYQDPEFPASSASLGAFIIHPNLTTTGVDLQEEIFWKRPKEIVKCPQLFIDGVDEGDVIQGQLGDCWFLGALAVVATRIDLLKELIVSAHSDYGFYQFRFYKVCQLLSNLIIE